MAGGYVTHGETLLKPNDAMEENSTPTLWWSHGGKLNGTSPERIAFLRKLVEESVPAAHPKFARSGMDPTESPYYLNISAVGLDGKSADYILYYFDFHQPIWYEFPLPEGIFSAEMIDPWAMTVHAAPGSFRGKTKLTLAGIPYQAVRFRRLS
jgi:hypothetical protein